MSYTEVARIALNDPQTIIVLREVHRKCLNNLPGVDYHRALLFSNGKMEYHRSYENKGLAAERKGTAFAFVTVRDLNKNDVKDIEGFVELNAQASFAKLKKLAAE